MAPFLHGRKVFADIRTYLRSLLSFPGSSKSGSRHTFHNMGQSTENFTPEANQWTSMAGANHNASAATDFPLQSIVVKQDLEQRWENRQQ